MRHFWAFSPRMGAFIHFLDVARCADLSLTCDWKTHVRVSGPHWSWSLGPHKIVSSKFQFVEELWICPWWMYDPDIGPGMYAWFRFNYMSWCVDRYLTKVRSGGGTSMCPSSRSTEPDMWTHSSECSAEFGSLQITFIAIPLHEAWVDILLMKVWLGLYHSP